MHLHHYYGPELEQPRERFSGQPLELLTGGAGMFAGAGTVTPASANAAVAGATAPGPHIGVVGIVLFAVLILFVLDRAGFRFAVTAGGRR